MQGVNGAHSYHLLKRVHIQTVFSSTGLTEMSPGQPPLVACGVTLGGYADEQHLQELQSLGVWGMLAILFPKAV